MRPAVLILRTGDAVLRATAKPWLAVVLAACGAPPSPAPPPPARDPVALTYLGVAGWQLEGGERVILADPYFSRPPLDVEPIAPDPAAIEAHAPAKADLIVIGHSHFDHLLDAPEVARRTGAVLLGSQTTAMVGRASGLPDEQLIAVKGGEDFAFDGFSVRAIPSLHSAIGEKHIFGGALTAPPVLPMASSEWQEGGTFAYLVRVAGHQILVLSTANFIERELDGLRPDIAIIATGLRQEIHDYTCRLLRALGHPPRVYANHFDDWRNPPVDQPPDEDLQAFVAEVEACAPGTVVTIPRHFERMLVP